VNVGSLGATGNNSGTPEEEEEERLKVRAFYIPLLTGKPEQQRFTMRSGVHRTNQH